jgi:alpha-N-acetylglucosaminidase
LKGKQAGFLTSLTEKMWLAKALCLAVLTGISLAQSTQGIYSLVQRQMPEHADSFQFSLVDSIGGNSTGYDQYIVSSTSDGKVLVEGTTISALTSG